MRTPPGVSGADFSSALQKISALIGKQWVFTSEEDLDLYRDAYSVLKGEPEERIASAALAPDRVEHVQEIARICNHYKIPLYPTSTGRNLGYGGSAPAYSGSVVLDLKRMNRIVEVNEKLHYCIVEPGVSFFDLHRYLTERNIKLYLSPPAPGWGSPIGNALDHGNGWRARDNFKNHVGMEVVLANGDLVRTGMGALPKGEMWATYHYGYGPYVDGIFSQSNFGIVTKMGFNLFHEPESTRRLNIFSNRWDDMDPMVEVGEHLEAIGVTARGFGFQSPLMGARTDPAVIDRIKRGISPREWEAYAREVGRPLWSTGTTFMGPPEMVDAQVQITKQRFERACPGVTFQEAKPYTAPLNEAEILQQDRNIFGMPAMYNFWTDLGEREWYGHVWFSPKLPQTGEQLRKANEVFQKALQPLDLYWGWRGGGPDHPKTFTILYSFETARSVEANQKTREGFKRVVAAAADNGWSEYRTAPAFYDLIADVFSYNDHALRRMQETLKDALDPNGILSAGRYGIWPKHLRGKRQ